MVGGWDIAVVTSLVLLATTALETSPKNPTERDVITLNVQRSFAEDCLWRVIPRVRRVGLKIDVTLDLRGEPSCDHVLVDRTFEIAIGPFPAGTYTLSVSWSDGEFIGSKPLTVVPARTEEE